MEILKTYLAHFKLKKPKVKTKVWVIVYHSAVSYDAESKLKEDLKKYFQTLSSNADDINIMTMVEACKGMIFVFSYFKIRHA